MCFDHSVFDLYSHGSWYAAGITDMTLLSGQGTAGLMTVSLLSCMRLIVTPEFIVANCWLVLIEKELNGYESISTNQQMDR